MPKPNLSASPKTSADAERQDPAPLGSPPVWMQWCLRAAHFVVTDDGITNDAPALLKKLQGPLLRHAALVDPILKVVARTADRLLPIEQVSRLRFPVAKVLPPAGRLRFEELLTRAFDRSPLLGTAALVPLLQALNAKGSVLSMEVSSSLGRSGGLGRNVFMMMERQATITRTAERAVLPFLATIEALALVGAGDPLPTKRPSSLGPAAHRLKDLGLDGAFVDTDFIAVRNAAAHHKARFDPTTQTIHLDQRDGTAISMPVDRMARLLMAQPILVNLYVLLAFNLILDRAFLGDGAERGTAFLRQGLRITAEGGYDGVTNWFNAEIETLAKRLHASASEDLEPASRFVALWRRP